MKSLLVIIDKLPLKRPAADAGVVADGGLGLSRTSGPCGEPGSTLLIIRREIKLGLGEKGRRIEVGGS